MINVAVHKAKKENKKVRTAKYFAGFLAFMLICTVISRGIYAYRMPQVYTDNAVKKMISHTIEADGIVENVRERAVVAETGIRVEEVWVQEGETVDIGDPLFSFDIEDLTELKSLLLQEITVNEQRLLEEQESQSFKEETSWTAEERAREDLADVTAEQNYLVELAQAEYDSAVNALAAYPDLENYCDQKMMESAEYQSLKSTAESADANEEEIAAFASFETAFIASATENWNTEKSALQAAADDALSSLNLAKSTQENAVKEAERALEDASKKEPDIQSTQTELNNTIANEKNLLSIYQTLLDSKGVVAADYTGTVQSIHISAGERTTDQAAMVLTDEEGGLQFVAEISGEDRAYLSEETTGSIGFSNGKSSLLDLSLSGIVKQENGNYQVRIDVTGMGLTLGETGCLTITASGNTYDCCVPVSALYSTGTEYYVWVIQETETFLGTEYSVERRKVVIETQNDAYAALKDSPIGAEEKIVVSTDQDLESGETVRMKED